jgi:hypothetical protein
MERISLVVSLLVWVYLIKIVTSMQSVVDLDQVDADLMDSTGNFVDLMDTTTPSDTDKEAAECLVKTVAQAVIFCANKTSEEQCSGAKQDWFCDQTVHQVCDLTAKNKTCTSLRQSQADISQDAVCCTWSSSTCSFDKTKPLDNFCDNSARYQACDNIPTEGMNATQKTCNELSRVEIQSKCNSDAAWANITDKPCRYSCFLGGNGYSNEKTCAILADLPGYHPTTPRL